MKKTVFCSKSKSKRVPSWPNADAWDRVYITKELLLHTEGFDAFVSSHPDDPWHLGCKINAVLFGSDSFGINSSWECARAVNGRIEMTEDLLKYWVEYCERVLVGVT